MHVGIITYNRSHLKTWQILRRLLTKPFRITLLAFPFVPKPQVKRVFEERPFQLSDINIKEFCLKNNIHYIEVEGWDDKNASRLDKVGGKGPPDVYLTCISKIIPRSFIKDRIIINAHPGLLPENRGLDAFKWSVVNGWPVGISLHVIDREIDKGILLHRIKIPIFHEDTLSEVAKRAYEMECDLQANFDYYLNRVNSGKRVTDKYPLSKKRIPHKIDCKLEQIFLNQREKLIRLSREKDIIK